MVQGVTPAHKGLSPSRLINYITVVKKMPMLGTIYPKINDQKIISFKVDIFRANIVCNEKKTG
jgi:hypothetical protein